MEIVKAQSNDLEQVLEFYNSVSLPGFVELNIQRKEPFDAFYKIQSTDYDIFCIRNPKDKSIYGCFTILYRQGLIDGQLEKMGYLTDLRVASDRQALLVWSNHFLEILENSKQQRQCQYMFSVLSQEAGKTYNTFLRGRTRINTFPRYHLLRKFVLITVHGRIPYLSNPLKTITIRQATENEFDNLLVYLQKKSKIHPLNFDYAKSSFLDRLKVWKGLSLKDFFLAFDSDNNIVGCVAPWDSSHLQSYQVNAYHGSIAGYRRLFALGSWFKITRPLPAPHRNLKFKFLTHLYVNNHDIFQALLCEVLHQSKKNEFLVYQNFDGDLQTWLPRYFIGWSMPLGLYSIGPESLTNPSLQPSPLLPAPFFEAALI